MARGIGTYEGTPSHPLTFLVLADLAHSLVPLSLLLLLFAAGELVWRERDTGLHEISDAASASTACRTGGKLLALAGFALLLLALVAGSGIAGQLSRGHVDLELALYARELLVFRLPTFLLFAVLSVAVHVLVDQKYVAHFVVALVYLAASQRALVGWSGGLLGYASDPGVVYSDFVGYGAFAWPFFVYKAYWAAAAFVGWLGVVGLWPRGTDTSLRERFRRARATLVSSRVKWLAAAALVVFVALGAFIHWQTAVLNRTAEARLLDDLEYERRYRKDLERPQPRVAAVSLRLDLQPDARSASIDLDYETENAGRVPIDALHLTLPGGPVDLRDVRCDRACGQTLADRRLGYFVYSLTPPLEPGERMHVRFRLALADRGFRFPQTAPLVQPNGTFLMSGSWAPRIGYQPGREVADVLQRRHHGLPEQPPLPPADDPSARTMSAHERVTFEAVVSTEAGQTAVAPGHLEREWSEGPRRFFAFRAERPILDHYAVVSGRYDLRRGESNGVALEVLFHPRHAFNVERVLHALRESVSWHAARLGPCPFAVIRVVEVPRYSPFAGRSYPGLIPITETGGLLARVEGEAGEIDRASSLVAHEVAHQWWGHAVAGARVLGGPLVQETLAQYSRLRLSERLSGAAAGRRLLDYARSAYFRERRMAAGPEPPLVAVDAQPHLYYDKGMLALHALGHRLGEERLERALAAYFGEVAARRPPLGTSLDLLRRLREAAPADEQAAITDLLERVTTYDARVVSASAAPHGTGFRVTARVALRKLQLQPSGLEQEVASGELVEIALLDATGVRLRRGRLFVAGPSTEIMLDVDRRPASVLLDPDGLLLEPVREDNEAAVAGS